LFHVRERRPGLVHEFLELRAQHLIEFDRHLDHLLVDDGKGIGE
jgi:hypothetical protein